MPKFPINLGSAFSQGVGVGGCAAGACIPNLGQFDDSLLENVENMADTLTMDLGFKGGEGLGPESA